ncbi:MAG: methyltransferase domain-containing protein, partial [Proteobacteria bacterium]|nr:methyltransferase domain-containing protein [Pseudomonadota bacterium]
MAGTWDHDVDVLFDDHLPSAVRPTAAIQFTPAQVVRQAARLLAPDPGARVLDVGAGAGKFCLIAANTVPTATFVGVERRADLVAVAQQLAIRLAIGNATFVVGDALD